MKKLIISFCAVLAAGIAIAQIPQKFNYQAIARNSSGSELANTNIGVKISILDGTASGPVLFSETHSVTTNPFGLFTMQIGTGTLVSGSFGAINWSTGSKFIKTEIDPAGGSSYTVAGASELISVPYAMYSGGAANANGIVNYLAKFTNGQTVGNSQIFDTGTYLGIGTTTPSHLLHLELPLGPGLFIKSTGGYASVDIDGSTGDAALRFYKAGTGMWNIRNRPNDDYLEIFEMGVTSRLTLQDGTGNLGVGADAVSTDKIYGYSNSSTVTAGIHGVNAYSAVSLSGVYGEFTGTGSYDSYGIRGGTPNTNDGYGYGGYFTSHYRSVYGNTAGGAYSGSAYGIYATASGTTGTRYGVYGYAAGGTTNYSVYASGNFTCTGTKAATVRTAEGPKEVYAQESPELWFEDFGSATINGGTATVTLAADYLQTVTIDQNHNMKVFITPNDDLGNWYVKKQGNSFTLYAPNAANGAQFDFRVVAKRKGYEDLRLKTNEGAWSDVFLYADINDVPEQHRADWVLNHPVEQWNPNWFSLLTGDGKTKVENTYKAYLVDVATQRAPQAAPKAPETNSSVSGK